MSLRTRIAGVAGLAVAIAVIAGAGLAYLAIRSELRGEVDNALRDRAAAFERFAVDQGFGTGGLPPDADQGVGPGPGPPPDFLQFGRKVAIFGGASGYVQFVLPNGAIARPGGEVGVLPATKTGASSGSFRLRLSARTCSSDSRIIS